MESASASGTYILRLWKVIQDAQPVWRASLRDARTGERVGFANLDDLTQFIGQKLTADPMGGEGCCAGDESV